MEVKKKSVIDFAEMRIKEEVEQNNNGADNEPIIRYWRAYIDGAKAQMKEDRQPSPNEATEVFLSALVAYVRQCDEVINLLNEEVQNFKCYYKNNGGK